MKNTLFLISILLFASSSYLYTIDEYLDILKYEENHNSIICLVEIQQLTTTEILTTCPTIKGNCLPAINVKVLDFYNKKLNIVNDRINLAFQVDLLMAEINNKYVRPNDLDKEIVFNKKIIISIRQSDCFNSHYVTSNIGTAFYVDKEPGKSIYRYLEKKYRKKK